MVTGNRISSTLRFLAVTCSVIALQACTHQASISDNSLSKNTPLSQNSQAKIERAMPQSQAEMKEGFVIIHNSVANSEPNNGLIVIASQSTPTLDAGAAAITHDSGNQSITIADSVETLEPVGRLIRLESTLADASEAQPIVVAAAQSESARKMDISTQQPFQVRHEAAARDESSMIIAGSGQETLDPRLLTAMTDGDNDAVFSPENTASASMSMSPYATPAKELALTLSDEDLDKTRGTFSPFASEVLNSTVLEANSSNNTSIGSVTGQNLITNQALEGSSGLVNLIQNSGNNVIIQSSTIVNLNMQ